MFTKEKKSLKKIASNYTVGVMTVPQIQNSQADVRTMHSTGGESSCLGLSGGRRLWLSAHGQILWVKTHSVLEGLSWSKQQKQSATFRRRLRLFYLATNTLPLSSVSFLSSLILLVSVLCCRSQAENWNGKYWRLCPRQPWWTCSAFKRDVFKKASKVKGHSQVWLLLLMSAWQPRRK